METLKLGAALSTRESRVQVDQRLPVGIYRIQLVVQGSSGKSEPATLLIRIVKE